MNNKYILELRIKDTLGEIYYFSFAVLAKNENVAMNILTSYKTGLKSNILEVIWTNKPIEEDNYIFPKEYSKGQIGNLVVSEWKFHKIESIPELDFDKHNQIVLLEDNTNVKEIAKAVMEHKIPIFQLNKSRIEEYRDLYYINVVKAD